MEKLTESQREAITSTGDSIAVVAAAGSGKTTVLIQRCLNIIGDDYSELDRLLAITFTEKAAAELKSRLRPHIPPGAHHRLTTAWIGTFHGCCARMLRQHAPLVGLDPAFAILDENASQLLSRHTVKATLISALERRDPDAALLVDSLDFKNAMGLMEDLMDFRWHARSVLAQPTSHDEEEKELLDAAANLYGQCELAYREAMAAQNAADFQELEILTMELLDEHPDVLKSYRRRFRHVLIDEFQDTNDVQTELVLKLYTPGTNSLCIVGDPRQSIYRFRGANVDCFQQVLERIRRTDGRVIPLTENFRSRPEIIEFVNRASDHMSDGLFGTHPHDEVLSTNAEKMVAARTDSSSLPAVVKLELEYAEGINTARRRRLEANAIATYILELVNKGNYHLGDIVCLFQALTSIGDYETAFKEREIPYRFFGGRGLLERQEICDLMHSLRYAANPNDGVALLGLLRSPLIGISDEECVKLAGPQGLSLRETARDHPSCVLLNDLEKLARHLKPSEILHEVIDRTGYEYLLDSLDSSGGMRANVDRLVMMAESVERQAPTTLPDFISFIGHLRDQNARVGDPPAAGDSSAAVRCMTVHTAKGLEFPVVVLPDLMRREPNASPPWIFHRQEGCAFKLKDPLHPFGKRIYTDRYDEIQQLEKFQSEAERGRLLYVALTRAKDMLVLPVHRDAKIKGKWHEWVKPLTSEGVERIPFHGSTIHLPERTYKPKDISAKTFDRARAQKSILTAARTFSVSQLEAFDRCPQEYYLKYVLGFPAANLLEQKGTTLPANIRGSIVHAVLEKLTPSNEERMEQLIRDVCMEHDVYPDAMTMDEIAKPIKEYMTSALFEAAGSGERETRFDWRIGNDTVTGYIDWYRETPEGLEVVDFKTDQVDQAGVTRRALEYELQMISYALALEHAKGAHVCTTALVFLTPNVTKRTEVDNKRRDEGLRRLEQIIGCIKHNNFEIAGIVPPCEKCFYHHNRFCWKDRIADHG